MSDRKGAKPPGGRTAARKRAAAEVDPFDFQQDSLGYALRRAQVRAYELFYGMLSEMGLSPARLTALSLIAMTPGINQAALAQRLGITGPSVLRMVDQLEDAGLIAREASAGDRRSYALALTAAGREKLEALRQHIPAYEAELAARLSADERRQLMALLDRVAE